MPRMDGDADAAVKARVHKGWNKFTQCVPLVTNKDVSLLMRVRVCRSCLHRCILHGSEAWPDKKRVKRQLE